MEWRADAGAAIARSSAADGRMEPRTLAGGAAADVMAMAGPSLRSRADIGPIETSAGAS
jgi:hypothetical protein